MKVRNGFVSNSSASSFIIAMKSDKPLNTVDAVMEFFGVVKGSQISKVLNPLFTKIARNTFEADDEEGDFYAGQLLNSGDSRGDWTISVVSVGQYDENVPAWFHNSDKFRGQLRD